MGNRATHKYNVGLNNQRNVILCLLMTEGNINTIELLELNFNTGRQRIHELRKQGWLIETVFESFIDSCGNYHPRVGRYFFRGGRNVST